MAKQTTSEYILEVKKARLLKKLQQANKLIFEAEQLLLECNKGDAQVDYCTEPNLSSVIDGISIKTKHIVAIWYQDASF